MKVGRNEPCPCGSGLKFKRCHGAITTKAPLSDMRRLVERTEADQRIRERQQGLGRQVLAAKVGDRQLVAIGGRMMQSEKWKTFCDFLADYIKSIFGGDWGNAEIAKPFAERHPLMQWYDRSSRYCRVSMRTRTLTIAWVGEAKSSSNIS